MLLGHAQARSYPAAFVPHGNPARDANQPGGEFASTSHNRGFPFLQELGVGGKISLKGKDPSNTVGGKKKGECQALKIKSLELKS